MPCSACSTPRRPCVPPVDKAVRCSSRFHVWTAPLACSISMPGAIRSTAAWPVWPRPRGTNGRKCIARPSIWPTISPMPTRPPPRSSRRCFASGPVEVGLARDAAAHPGTHGRTAGRRTATPFQPGDAIVLSGGARGVTAEVAVALARAFRPTLVLLGRTSEPSSRTGLARRPDQRGRDQA